MLAEAGKDSRPLDAARLFHPIVADMLERADTRAYPKVAKILVELRGFYELAGAEAEFAEYVAEIRSVYARRPALMAALDKKKL